MTVEYAFKTSTTNRAKERVLFKNHKQIINAEAQTNYPPNAVLYHAIAAPPSLRPPIKVSDLSGIPTAYTDPMTRLNYATCNEFITTHFLPSEIVNGYLNVRGISNQL